MEEAVGLFKSLRAMFGQPSEAKDYRDKVRSDANRQAREAMSVAGSSKILREIEISDAQYHIRVHGRGVK